MIIRLLAELLMPVYKMAKRQSLFLYKNMAATPTAQIHMAMIQPTNNTIQTYQPTKIAAKAKRRKTYTAASILTARLPTS
jgi:hypothetical protein